MSVGGVTPNNNVRPTTVTKDQVKADPKVIDPKELEGKTEQEVDNLAAARAETLAAKKPDGTFDFTNNTTSSGQALDPAGKPLGRNSTGAEVAALQQQLNINGANPQLTVDGRFGGKTTEALKAYQAANGLKADGKAGPDTINTMKANDAISRMNQFGNMSTPEGKAAYATAKAEAEKAMAAMPAEAKAKAQTNFDAASAKAVANQGPGTVDTSKPAVEQANQAAANANAATTAADKKAALDQGNAALAKAKEDAAKMPWGPARTAEEGKNAAAEANLNQAAATATTDAAGKAQQASLEARVAADDAAAKQRAADAGANTPQAADLQKAATEAKTSADAKAKAAEQAVKDAQALADHPNTPQAVKDQAKVALAAANADLSSAKTTLNTTAPRNGTQSPEQKAAMDKAIAEARVIAKGTNTTEAQNQAGAKLAEGILAQPGVQPDGTAKRLVEELGNVPNKDEVVAGLVNKLGPEGLAKLSDADKQYLRDNLGWGLGWTSDAPQVKAGRLLGMNDIVTLDFWNR